MKEPIPRGRGEVPWGFKVDPADPHQLLPEIHQLEVLEEGLRYRLKGHSARVVAGWITARAGRRIDHRQVDRRLEKERRLFRQRQKTLPPLPEVSSDAV